MIAPNNNKTAPVASGGGSKNLRSTSYRPGPPETRHPGNWFNPRRRLYCEKLIYFIRWRGSKIGLPDQYESIKDEMGIDRYAVDVAVDDLYTLGLIDMCMYGERCSIELLSADLDSAAVAPTVKPTARPTFALAPPRQEVRS